MSGTEHEGEWKRLRAQWRYDPDQNCFPLPNEVFQLGLKAGALLYTLKPIRQVMQEREKEFLAELKLAEAQCKWAQWQGAAMARA